MVALLVLLTIITFLTVDYVWQRRAIPDRAGVAVPRSVATSAPTAPGLDLVPAGVFVGPGHAWVHLEPSGALRVGADRLPSTLLGGLDGVELLAPGTEVRRGDALAVLRRGTRSMSLRSPVNGVVAAVNDELVRDPAALETEPFDSWIYRLTPEGIADTLKGMFVADEATAWMRQELGRLRDSLAGMVNGTRLALATLPDGGLPVRGLAEHLGEAEWRDLTSRFFDIPVPTDVDTV
jgi:glycine cleavage system H lipoate-binding protein